MVMGVDNHKQMILNGVMQVWQYIDTPFVYQNIHTLGYQPKNLAEHITVLNNTAKTLFRQQLNTSERNIKEQIYTLLSMQRLSLNVTICVVLKIYATGDYSLEYEEPSIYRGYALRGLRPEACYLNLQPDVSGPSSSASLAARKMADAIAKSRHAHIAIMLDANNNLVFEPSFPLFCVINEVVVLPQDATESVELKLVEKAARSCGLKICQRTISKELINSADEVLIASWQGITSISNIDNQIEYFWTIIAERLVEGMRAMQ